jgi:hypothetical protein
MAFGKERFIEMAKWLGMSLRLNAPNLPSAILTDSSDPELAELYTHVIKHTPEMGDNMYPKFCLDQLSPFDETIYIDTDCLVLNNLDDLFKVFENQYFGVSSFGYLTSKHTATDVDVPFVLNRFHLERLPKFNGGLYYFRRGPEAAALFHTARTLLADAKNLRIGNYKGGGFSDEPLFALAIALHNIELVSAVPRGMFTPLYSRGPIVLDVFGGKCCFRKRGALVNPDVVHFSLGYRECFAYHREVWKLKAHFGKRVPSVRSRFRIWIQGLLWQIKRTLRNQMIDILRPEQEALLPGSKG